MVKWHRELTFQEHYLARSSFEYNCYNVTYWLDIAATEPITKNQFHNAFLNLLRKCENLRSVVRERDGRLWFVEKESELVDLQITKGKPSTEVMEELRTQTYSLSSDLLWKAAVLEHGSSDNKYTIFINYSHPITDGLTCTKIFRALKDLLENELHGEDHDTTQIGKMVFGNEVTEIVGEEEEFLLKNPTLIETSWKSFQKITTPDQLLARVYTTPEGGDYRNEMLQKSLNECDTSLLVSRCKANGVTVNSALTAALNVAYVTALTRFGIVQDSYKITSSHFVSLRRHMQHGGEALGTIVGNYIHSENITKESTSSFWDYTKSLHQDLHPNIAGKGPIRQEALLKLNNFKADVGEGSPFYSYVMSNYTSLDLGRERKIKTLYMARRNELGRGDVCLFFIFFTLKGKLISLADYIPGYIHRAMVEEIHSGLFSIIQKEV